MASMAATTVVSLALKLFCGDAWKYRPARGRLRYFTIAWEAAIVAGAVFSFFKPAADFVFLALFSGFLISAQLRNVYLCRVEKGHSLEDGVNR
jgi:hypothetical protein